jgi:type IV secretory pathway TrbD component
MELRRIPVHQSLIRPESRLILGADRNLIFFLYMVVTELLLVLPWTWVSLSVSILVAVIGHPALVALSKYDPEWRRVVSRHILYQPVYLAAGAHPLAKITPPFPSVPTVKEVR